MMRFLFCSSFIIFASLSNIVYADDFVITQQIGIDTVAPTIPSPVAATAITSSQIDVTWGASTDDVSLSGYRLFRDGVQIATTSLRTYSDTGLIAGTTYVYTVQAYDWSMNISTTSVSATATTPSAAPQSFPNASQTGLTRVRLLDITITPEQTEVAIAWKTNVYAQYTLRWGRGDQYGLGFVRNELFKRSHQTVIPDLEPGVTYVYELIAYNQLGREYVLSKDTFTTKKAADTTPPQNVQQLSATAIGNAVQLDWVLPDDTDLQKIRIVRNNTFYPTDTSNGYIVYQGLGHTFLDTNALKYFDTQYYTVFTYDQSGNVSSGAVVRVARKEKSVPNNIGTGDTPSTLPTPSTTSTLPSQSLSLDFSQVIVSQRNQVLPNNDGYVTVQHGVPVVMDIPYELFPEHLKTIIVTLENEKTMSVSYMLRVNQDKTAYEAVIPPLQETGTYTLLFSVYDYQTAVLTTFPGTLFVKKMDSTSAQTQRIMSIFPVGGVFFGVILLLFLLILYILVMRKRTD